MLVLDTVSRLHKFHFDKIKINKIFGTVLVLINNPKIDKIVLVFARSFPIISSWNVYYNLFNYILNFIVSYL